MSLWLGQLGNHASRIDNKLDCCCYVNFFTLFLYQTKSHTIYVLILNRYCYYYNIIIIIIIVVVIIIIILLTMVRFFFLLGPIYGKNTSKINFLTCAIDTCRRFQWSIFVGIHSGYYIPRRRSHVLHRLFMYPSFTLVFSVSSTLEPHREHC